MPVVKLKLDVGGTIGHEAWCALQQFPESQGSFFGPEFGSSGACKHPANIPHPKGEWIGAEVLDRHVTALASASPVDVVSSDRHTVKPWFQGKLAFTFNLPELAGSPFTLAGGRMVFVDGEPGAHLIYDIRKHHESVLIFQDRGDFARLLPASEKAWRSRSFNVETWNRGGLQFFVVSDAAPEDVSALAELLKKAN